MIQIMIDSYNILGMDSDFLVESLVEDAPYLRGCDEMGLGSVPVPSSELTAHCAQAGRFRQQLTQFLALEDQATAILLGNELKKLDDSIAKWCG